jgi:nucleoside-diphosphate-sugar epimerase
MIVTGASGFVGRNLLDALDHEGRIAAISRRSPGVLAPSLRPNVRWYQVDIAERRDLSEVFAEIRSAAPVEVLIHLAGHYDFTGERSPEYRRTNVDGMRNVLDAARDIGVRDVVFTSSVAACAFPPAGEALTETSPPDGDSPYAESKRAGEALLAEYRGAFRSWIVRLAALYSDWCEYEPVFRFLETWLSHAPRSRVLAGCGLSAVPYLHIRDAVDFLHLVLARRDFLNPDDVLLASPDGATSHLELFEAATAAHFGSRSRPIRVPRTVCRLGLRGWDVARRALGIETFERPWMGRYIDLQLSVDAHLTRERLGWAPRPRLGVVRRMPFLIQHRKALPAEWQRRNHAALKSVRHHENLRICRLLGQRAGELSGTLTRHVFDAERSHRFPRLQATPAEQHRIESEALLDALIDAVRTGEKGLFVNPCREIAERRRDQGLPLEELTAALDALNDLCVLSLAGEGVGPGWSLALYDHVTMTVQFGVDEVHDAYEGTS